MQLSNERDDEENMQVKKKKENAYTGMGSGMVSEYM